MCVLEIAICPPSFSSTKIWHELLQINAQHWHLVSRIICPVALETTLKSYCVEGVAFAVIAKAFAKFRKISGEI